MKVDVHGDLNERDVPLEEPDDDSPEHPKDSLKAWIQSNIPSKIANDRIHAHGIIHRLDTLTSGPILVARNYRGFYSLRTEFATNQITKEYSALCHGLVPAALKLSDRLKHSQVFNGAGVAVATRTEVTLQGKPALTEVLASGHYRGEEGDYSLTRLKLHTGRTHQIRVHLSHANFPLVCDPKYGREFFAQDKKNFPRIFLHCHKLGFSGGFADCPIPADLATPLVRNLVEQ
jgi:23S rRNA pseudouridine1911/1915/1917 synthase